MQLPRLTTLAEPETTLEELAKRLSDPDAGHRSAAAARLGDWGVDAQELLCGALRDRDLEVRMAAVRSLGAIGDERAIGPLTEALRSCFIGRSAATHLLWGVLLLLVVLTVIGSFLWGIIAVKVGGGLGALISPMTQVAIRAARSRQRRSRLCLAVTEALEQIAARHPSPRLREVLPELRTLSLDVMQQEAATRTASRGVAQRIEELTADLKDLPLASAPPAASPDTLPLPAHQGDDRHSNLPH